jgi:hypothetical protein
MQTVRWYHKPPWYNMGCIENEKNGGGVQTDSKSSHNIRKKF